MSRIVLLVEDQSMRVLLDRLLPRLFPGLSFLCVKHEGKSDLEKSIPRKLRAWRERGARFVVLRDTDGADCRELKRSLVKLCRAGGRDDTVVRLACQELEAWYLGDPQAVADAFAQPSVRDLGNRARYRDPDTVQQPAKAIADLVPTFQKVSGARAMAMHLTAGRNSSRSFQVFFDGIRRLAESMSSDADGPPAGAT